MARSLDLRSLRAFLAVADEGSIRRAAERLHVTQPPLSRQLRAMEEALGGKLFERAPSGVTLTPLGQALARRGRRLLADAEDLVRDLGEAAREAAARDVRVGITHAFPVPVARRITASFERALRGRKVDVRRDYSLPLSKALRAGTLDFALISVSGETPGLATRHLYSDPLVAVLPAKHPAARRKIVALRDLGETPLFWNARSFNPPFHDHCVRVFRASRFRPRYVTVPPAQVVTLERIGQGEGCTLVNRSRSVTRIPGVVYRPLVEGAQLAVHLVAAWKPGHDDDLAQRLAALASRQFRKRPAR